MFYKKTQILGIACNDGQTKLGVEKGPYRIINHPSMKEIIDNKDVDYIGIINNDSKYDPLTNIVDTCLTINTLLSLGVENKTFSIHIGGDHSFSMGTLTPFLNKYDDLKVIWIDAHADINTIDSSISKNIHGMPLAQLTGLMNIKNLTNNKLPFFNLYYMGIRDLDKFEWDVIKENQVQYKSSKDITKFGIDSCYQDLKKSLCLTPHTNVFISLDIDSIDPLEAPGTGVKAENGISSYDLFKLLGYVFKDCNVVGFDLMEVNPLLDINNKTVDLAVNLIKYIFDIKIKKYY